MNVSDIMTRNPLTVRADTPVQQVARLLLRPDISGVPVLAHDGALIGMVTAEDLIVRHANLHLPTYVLYFTVRGEHAFEDDMRRALATRADQVMGERLHLIGPDADVADAATMLMDRRTEALAVVADGALVGVIGRGDIVRLMVRKDEEAETAPHR